MKTQIKTTTTPKPALRGQPNTWGMVPQDQTLEQFLSEFYTSVNQIKKVARTIRWKLGLKTKMKDGQVVYLTQDQKEKVRLLIK